MITERHNIPYFEMNIDGTKRIYFPSIFKKDPRYSVAKGKESYSIIPLYCGFDIETTNEPDTKTAYMYIASFSLATEREHIIYHFRTWGSVVSFLDELSKFYALDAKHHAVCFIANMGFEFQFMRKWINWGTDFFAKEHRKPLLAMTANYIEFRESLTITGGSLSYLSEHYTHTKKLVGDLDYSIPRNTHTVLSREPRGHSEMDYVNNDVAILTEFSYYILTQYVAKDHKFPLTRTGILQAALKRKIKQVSKDFNAYLKYISGMFPSLNDYILYYDKLFRGGYVHGNIYWVNEILPNIDSWDETSAYPTMMLLCANYPVTPFVETLCNLEIWFEYCIQNYACIIDATFERIERTTCHSIESETKCIDIQGGEIDNGRIKYADKMRVLLTELDFESYKEFYHWGKMTVNRLQIAKRGMLPAPLRDLLKQDYIYKDTLKRTGRKNTQEYEIYKSRVNTWYGLLVKRISLDNWKYTNNDGWNNTEKTDIDFVKETERMILCPQWGWWVTANARRALLKVVYKCEQVHKNSVVYNDTDSCKVIQDEHALGAVIYQYNAGIQERKRELGLTEQAFETLGCFDFEETYKRFKTLGAKRYLVEEQNGDFVATIAGFPKSAIKNIDDPFERFSVHGMKLLPVESMKKTAFYNDETTDAIIAGERMTELSSVCIYDIPFSMSLGKEFYCQVLSQFERKGKKL